MPDKPPPLPTPPDLHALQNRIALSLSSRTSLLAKSRSAGRPVPKHAPISEDLDLRSLGDANAGVGYVPEKKDTAAKAQDRMLRNKLLSKQRGGSKGKQPQEESEDEDLGRSALGKKKRKRKRPAVEDDEHEAGPVHGSGDDDTPKESQDKTQTSESNAKDNKPADLISHDATGDPPRKKKKNKKKQKAP